MKRVITAIVVLILIIAVCVADSLVTDSFEKETYRLIENIKREKNADMPAESAAYINEMIDLFERKEKMLVFFANKSIVDDIERSVYRLKDFNDGDHTVFMAEISVLETEIKELKRSTGLFLESVF
ncbi:MAG: DUF4363 family protein [Clostridia bacterium]|nr:DUF4363 family protein [Clostridia bacterium]